MRRRRSGPAALKLLDREAALAPSLLGVTTIRAQISEFQCFGKSEPERNHPITRIGTGIFLVGGQ